MNKLSLLIIMVLTTGFLAQAKPMCAADKYGKWTLSDHLIKTWSCDIDVKVGGLTLGVLESFQLMAGRGVFHCRAYDLDGDVVGCYREKVDLGLIGHGVGIGLSVVDSMRVHSIGINLLDLDPENFMGLARLGIGANAGVQVGELAHFGQANMSFALANGLNFDVGLLEAKGFGLYAGANITGFVMGEEGYKGVVVDTADYFGHFFTNLYSSLKSQGSNVDDTIFSQKNLMPTVQAATDEAQKQYPDNKKFGIRVYANDPELEGLDVESFVKRGIVKAENTCQGILVKVFVSVRCESEECAEAYFRAICGN